MSDGLRTRSVTLREMVEAMAHYPDDAPFRWYQDSGPGSLGAAFPRDTLLVTMGQVRRDLGLGE